MDSGGPSGSRAVTDSIRPDADDPWARRNILSFDGGGIRGYFSLLVLRSLMSWIYRMESDISQQEGDANPVQSSYDPCEPLPDASHIPPKSRTESADFLPCHYFDFICGTSTGGLITIMLARLRMPVDDCLREYRALAGSVFGHPRQIHSIGVFGITSLTERTKYRTSRLEYAIKDVVSRRGEQQPDQYDSLRFETEVGLCRAFVFTDIQDILGKQVTYQRPFILRSYHNLQVHSRNRRLQGGVIQPTQNPGPRNPGKATIFPVWKVGRATTAAEMFFEPLEISISDGSVLAPGRQGTGLSRRGTSTLSGTGATRRPRVQTVLLTDSGLGRINNPAQEALNELRSTLRSHQRIDVFVSIGTARPREPPKRRKTFIRSIRRSFEEAGDPNAAHEVLQTAAEAGDFSYFRLNSENGLEGMQMDEWVPSGSGENSGARTIERMENAFDRWAALPASVTLLQNCARELVMLRRARSRNLARWERYATGRFYVCPEANCQYDREKMWNDRDEFQAHLAAIHPQSQLDPNRDCVGGNWVYKSRATDLE